MGKLYVQGKIVREEEIGESYTQVSDHYEGYFLKEMHVYNNKLLQSVIKNSSNEVTNVLDLACGTGYNSCQLAKSYEDAHFYLVDISKGMLEKAQDKKIKNAYYSQQDMLSFLRAQKSESFDRVVCCWAIKYQPPQKIIKEVHRILKKDGIFGVIVNTKKTLPEIRSIYPKLLINSSTAIQEIMRELPNPKDGATFLKWFKKESFEVIEAEEGKHVFEFSDSKEVVQWVTRTGALAGFDCMIDLKNKAIQEQMIAYLAKERITTITHTFVWGVFKK